MTTEPTSSMKVTMMGPGSMIVENGPDTLLEDGLEGRRRKEGRSQIRVWS